MKKISTLFKKDPNDLSRVINEVDPQNDWVYDGEAIPTRKFDGTACAIINGILHKRFDLKKGRSLPKSLSIIPCQEPDKITGHHPHWVSCSHNDKSDIYFIEAFAPFVAFGLEEGTYELVGPKINGNKDRYESHLLVKHGSQVLPITDFTFEGCKKYLENHDIEGIVFHGPNGEMCKIRRKDFGFEW